MKCKTRASDSLGAMTAGSIGSGIFRSKDTPQDDERWKQNYVDPKSLQRNDAGCKSEKGDVNHLDQSVAHDNTKILSWIYLTCAWQQTNPIMNLPHFSDWLARSRRFWRIKIWRPSELPAPSNCQSLHTHVVYAALRNDMLPCQAQWMPLRTPF